MQLGRTRRGSPTQPRSQALRTQSAKPNDRKNKKNKGHLQIKIEFSVYSLMITFDTLYTNQQSSDGSLPVGPQECRIRNQQRSKRSNTPTSG
jgi:hypothetical protein